MSINFISILNLKKDGACCSILKIDDLVILLDCGINKSFDISKYQIFKNWIENVNLVFLSHSSYQFCGALPFIQYMFKKQPLIYSTNPVSRMSSNGLFDLIITQVQEQSSKKLDRFQTYKRIYQVYEKIKDIKFLQKQNYSKSLNFIAYPIGNSLGACAWHIEYDLINIVYLVSYQMQNEIHLDGLGVKHFNKIKIDFLVTNYDYLEVKQTMTNEKMSYQFKQMIDSCFEQNKNVLIVSQQIERSLEILLMIQKIWNQELMQNQIYFYNINQSYLSIAKIQIEFMSKQLSEMISSGCSNPFDQEHLKNIKILTQQDLESNMNSYFVYQKKPFVLICSQDSLLQGPFKEFMHYFNQSKNSSIIYIGNDQKDFANNFNQKAFMKLNLDDEVFNLISFQNDDLDEKMEIEDTQASTKIGDVFSQHDNISVQQDQEQIVEENDEILFTITEFPRYFFEQQKNKNSPYGQLIKNNEINNWDQNDFAFTSQNIEQQFSSKPQDYMEYTSRNFNCFINSNKVQKCSVTVDQNLPLQLQILKFDQLNGVCDADSMIQLIDLMNPQQILFINGNQNQKQIITSFLQSKQVFSFPDSLQIINFEFDNQYISVSKNIDLDRPTLMSGNLHIVFDPNFNKFEYDLDIYKTQYDEMNDQKYYFTWNFSTLYLYEFLNANGINIQLEMGGVLNFQNKVQLKNQEKFIILEGIFCNEFYQIRSLLYKLLQC